MLDKTKTTLSDLLRKSVGLPASDSSCCNSVSQELVEAESPDDGAEDSQRGMSTARSGCCAGGSTIETADRGRGDRP